MSVADDSLVNLSAESSISSNDENVNSFYANHFSRSRSHGKSQSQAGSGGQALGGNGAQPRAGSVASSGATDGFQSPKMASPVGSEPRTPVEPSRHSEFTSWLEQRTAERNNLLRRISRVIEHHDTPVRRPHFDASPAQTPAAGTSSVVYNPFYPSPASAGISGASGVSGVQAPFADEVSLSPIRMAPSIDSLDDETERRVSARLSQLSFEGSRTNPTSPSLDLTGEALVASAVAAEASLSLLDASAATESSLQRHMRRRRQKRAQRAASGSPGTVSSTAGTYTSTLGSDTDADALHQIERLSQENRILRQRLDACMAAERSHNQAGELEAAQEVCQQQRGVIRRLTTNVAELTEQLDVAAEAHEQAEHARAHAEEELTLVRSQAETLTQEKLTLFLEVAQAQQTALSQEERVHELEAQVEVLRKNATALHDAQTEDDKTQKELEAMQAQEAHREALEAQEALHTTVMQQAARIASLEKRLAASQASIDSLSELVSFARQHKYDGFFRKELAFVVNADLSADDSSDGGLSVDHIDATDIALPVRHY